MSGWLYGYGYGGQASKHHPQYLGEEAGLLHVYGDEHSHTQLGQRNRSNQGVGRGRRRELMKRMMMGEGEVG